MKMMVMRSWLLEMGQFLSMEVSKYSKGYYPIIDLMITVIW